MNTEQVVQIDEEAEFLCVVSQVIQIDVLEFLRFVQDGLELGTLVDLLGCFEINHRAEASPISRLASTEKTLAELQHLSGDSNLNHN